MTQAVALVDVYDPQGFALQLATDFLYKLMVERSSEDDPHTNISHRKLPAYAEHRAYVARIPYRNWYLPMDRSKLGEEAILGSVSLTRLNEIGIVLLREHRGKAWGEKILRQVIATHDPLPELLGHRRGCWLANINPGNERSIALFKKLGAVHIQNTFEVPSRGESNGHEEKSTATAR